MSLPTTFSSLDELEPFAHQHTTLGDVHKTGLGSSAALITSLVTALMHHFGLSPNLDLVHNMAQYVHCLAQGKVGSGFDICSAVKGSQVYTRFDERVLRGLMSRDEVTGQEVSRVTLVPERGVLMARTLNRFLRQLHLHQNGQHAQRQSPSRQISA